MEKSHHTEIQFEAINNNILQSVNQIMTFYILLTSFITSAAVMDGTWKSLILHSVNHCSTMPPNNLWFKSIDWTSSNVSLFFFASINNKTKVLW